MKKENEINRSAPGNFSSTENHRIRKAIEENKELVPALESIYSSLYIM